TVRAGVGATYKAIWLSGDGMPLLGNAPQLLGLLDPAVDTGHTVTPTAEYGSARRIGSTPVAAAGAFLRFPDDAPPADAPAQVRHAFDLLRQLNQARSQLATQPQQHADVAAAHLVADYFDTSGWVLNGRYLEGEQITQASGLVQEEQFQRAEEARQ